MQGFRLATGALFWVASLRCVDLPELLGLHGFCSAGLPGRERLPGWHELEASRVHRVLVAAVGVHDVDVARGGKVRRAGRADSARRTATRAAALAARCDGAATPALQTLHAPSLTRREWAIVRLAAEGLTNDDIADRLTVSVRTVHNHLHHAYTKLGVHHRTELGPVLQAQPQPPTQHPPAVR